MNTTAVRANRQKLAILATLLRLESYGDSEFTPSAKGGSCIFGA